MILYPAIDLKDGKCVRLVQGDMDKATVFGNSPTKQALAFQDAGCEWLHIVDLNGAFKGRPMNGKAVESILKACPKMKIQLGGGIRNMKTIEYWLDKGIARVILGTAAVENFDLVCDAAKKFPKQIAIGIDAKDGVVAIHGWAKPTKFTAASLARTYQKYDIAAIIYTDIARDGAMKGPNIKATAEIATGSKIPVIASGGVSNLNDLYDLQRAHRASSEYKNELSKTRPLNGAIVGRALYDKKIDIKKALALLNE